MKIVVAVGLFSALIGAVLGALRWLRVAQREHYLAGSASRFAFRWWRSRHENEFAWLVCCVLVLVSAKIPEVIFAVALLGACGPRGLSLRGRSAKLRWTRRLATVAAASAVAAGAVVALGAGLNGLKGAMIASGVLCLATPLLIDGVLASLRPIERAIGQRYVRSARAILDRVDPTIVAITGSYGKTSTKGYVAHLLSGRFQVLASPHSYNNEAGLSRTVNELLAPGTEVLVAEMGAYGRGEIASLCQWLPPTVAVITAIGPVHLERFKSLETTVQAKSEIVVGARTVVLNVDDERLSALSDRLLAEGRSVTTCSARRRDVSVSVIEDNGVLGIAIDQVSVGEVRVDGEHGAIATNVACAIGAALALGCTADEIVERLGSLPSVQHRLEVRRAASGAVLLDDTFNSNPRGARLALARLAAMSGANGHRVVVTPGMVELGPLQFEENAAFAREVTAVATDVVIVGRTNREALRSGAQSALPTDHTAAPHPGRASGNVREVENRDEAVSYVAMHFGAGDVVLYENDLPDHYP